MIHEILEILAEDTHGDAGLTCTHPTESVSEEKRGGWTYYTCDACGAERADFVVGCELHMGEWSGGRKSPENRFDDLMEKLAAWAVETGNEVLVVKTGREDDSSGYQLMGECSGQMEKAVKWVQGSLFGRGDGGADR